MHESHADMPNLESISDPRVAVDHLAGDFFGLRLAAEAEILTPSEVPPPFDSLLVHELHMTTVLEKFHGQSLRLEVVEDRLIGSVYARKILLSLANSGFVVEVGAVRIHLQHTADAVREAILRRERPLGEILISHRVLRRIEPKWFMRFQGTSPIVAAFDRPNVAPVYGRVGLIHCDGEPAIELLEVVSGECTGA
ncbi:MAG: hypothetical protein KF841_10170 [Phycisphaerae bacterium]|nr:hypothetical protein [Phycisphaerae bacterium]